MHIHARVAASVLVGAFAFALAGCSAPAPSPTTPTVTTIETPTPTPTAEAEQGSRQNPLAIGEHRKLSEESMWTLGAEGATAVNDGYVVLPLRIGMDWDAYAKQIEESGEDATIDAGAEPWYNLTIEFVTAAGRSYDQMDNYNVEIANDISSLGTVYPPAEAVSVNVPISVPSGEIAGGMWVIKNGVGDAVFIASQ